jgi:lipopolysaccharide/colanic/teichoic acid biosynthesis glycosyltransferase
MAMYDRMMKRLADLLIASVSLLVLSPLMAITAVAIRLEDGGPVLFRQTRVGRAGRAFRIFKFRSMPVATEHVPSASAQPLRVTRVGRWIRRTNVDELPQLLNVLSGDMSIVGPRPALPSQRRLCALRTSAGADRCRPGLTGLAQINAFDGMPDDQKARWDAEYSRTVSFGLDVRIILRTFLYLTRRPPVY